MNLPIRHQLRVKARLAQKIADSDLAKNIYEQYKN